MTTETKKKTTKKASSKKKTKASDLVFITSERCGWCKKAEPVVEELRKDGFTITALDMTNEKDAKRANEIKQKHSAQCGTPLFIDAVTGNSVCGFREKDVLEKWANGEEIPKPPPRPQQQQQQQEQVDQNQFIIEELIQPYKLFVGKSKLNGYGVFAADDIRQGEIVEEASFVKTSYRTKDLVHPELKQILYPMACSCETCKHRGQNFVLSSGYIQIYNHAENPDVRFDWLRNERVIRVTAIKDISEGSEVFHTYGPNYGHNMRSVRI